MSDMAENPYQVPESNLVQKTDPSLVTNFPRQSAWAVFGLALITLGIYPYFWLYSRAKIVNEIHEKPISLQLVGSLIVLALLNYTTNFWGETMPAAIAVLVVTVVSLVIYIMVVFKFRNRLQDILTRSSGTQYKVGGIMAFFFYSIYFQYKINECSDEVIKDS